MHARVPKCWLVGARWLVPELRRFSDADCARLLAESFDVESPRWWDRSPAGTIVAAILFAGFVSVVIWFQGSTPAWVWSGSEPSAWGWLLGISWVLTFFAVAMVFEYWGNRLGRARRLRRMLRRTRCRSCRADLHGPAAPDAAVRCSRCGVRTLYGPAVTIVDQIIEWSRSAHLTSNAAPIDNCDCGYPLAGLPVAQGRIRCPECGADYRAVGPVFVRRE